MTTEPMSYRSRSKDPTDVLAEAEQQWIYTEDELRRTPSIVDGMPVEEERLLRGKATNFITQVGIMLKLPQTTLSTASVFCHRYLMRQSLVKRQGYVPLHHYQIAAISLFIATKSEEHTRKLKELVIACVRVALKKPDMPVDEQTRDFWRWRDTIIYNEDVILEMLAFDLTIDSPYKILYDLLKAMQLHHNRKLRDAAWSFVNDTTLTQACLLYTSLTIAAASLYYAAKTCDDGVEIPSAADGRPWWQSERVKLAEVKRCMNYMADFFESSPSVPSTGPNSNPYANLRTPIDEQDEDEIGVSPDAAQSAAGVSPAGTGGWKRERMEDGEQADEEEGEAHQTKTNGVRAAANGKSRVPVSRIPQEARVPPPVAKRRKTDDRNEEQDDDDGSEEGEI